jgi:hypothetical protein
MSEIIPGEDTKKLPLAANAIETIDGAFLNYVENLNLHCETINGKIKTPVIWASAERAYQIKHNHAIRDKNGTLIPPIISVERVSITKDPNNKGPFQSNVSPGNDRYFVTKVLNQDKTSNFVNADTKRKTGQLNFQTSKKNKKIVYQHVQLRIPVYVTVEYKINILTNYQSQMNELVQPFIALTAQNYFIIEKDDYRFESFMDPSFEQDSISELGEEERKYKTTITVKVLGQLVGEDLNKTDRTAKLHENGFLKIVREDVFFETPDKKLRKREISSGIGIGGGDGRSGVTDLQIIAPLKKVFLIGNGVDSLYEIQHNLGSKEILVSMRENFGSYQKVEFYCVFQDNNTLLVDTGDPIGQDSYMVIIMDGMANLNASGSIITDNNYWSDIGGVLTADYEISVSGVLAPDATITSLTSSQAEIPSIVTSERTDISVTDNNLDLQVAGNNINGTQILLNAENNAGVSQVIAQAETYAILQAGTSGSWPFYVYANAPEKFIAIECEDDDGVIYIGANEYQSDINIGTVSPRIITIGNTSSYTEVNIKSNVGTNISGNVYLNGNLMVFGALSYVTQSATSISGNIFLLASGAVDADMADNSGLQVYVGNAADPTFLWDKTGKWVSSEDMDLASGKKYKINDDEVLRVSDFKAVVGGTKDVVMSGSVSILGAVTASNLSGQNTGDVTLGTANGLSLASQQLSLAAASAGTAGAVTTGSQTFAGTKTFSNLTASNISVSGIVSASSYLGLPLGNHDPVTIGEANGLSLNTQELSLASASANSAGAVTTGSQTLAGDKTFSGSVYVLSTISASNYLGLPISSHNAVTIGTANGLSLNDQELSMATASANTIGTVSTGSQIFAGNKTFSGSLNTAAQNAWAKPQLSTITTVTSSGGTLTIDLSLSNDYITTLTENITMSAPTNAVAGQSGMIIINQNSSSAMAISCNSFWKFPNGTPPTASTALNAIDVLSYYVVSSSYAICNYAKGFA